MKFSTLLVFTVGAIVMVFAASGEAGAEPETVRVVRRRGNRGELDFPDRSGGLEPGHLLLS